MQYSLAFPHFTGKECRSTYPPILAAKIIPSAGQLCHVWFNITYLGKKVTQTIGLIDLHSGWRDVNGMKRSKWQLVKKRERIRGRKKWREKERQIKQRKKERKKETNKLITNEWMNERTYGRMDRWRKQSITGEICEEACTGTDTKCFFFLFLILLKTKYIPDVVNVLWWDDLLYVLYM